MAKREIWCDECGAFMVAYPSDEEQVVYAICQDCAQKRKPAIRIPEDEQIKELT